MEGCWTTLGGMASLVLAIVTYILCFFVPRHRLALEAAALRQQLAVLKRKQPRPKLSRAERLFGRMFETNLRDERFLPLEGAGAEANGNSNALRHQLG